MSLEDIRLMPIEINFEGQKLKLEIDYTAIAYIEAKTKKSIFKIKDEILNKNLFLSDSIAVFVAALLKHQSEEVVKDVEKKLEENVYLIERYNIAIVNAFMKPLLAPEIYNKVFEKEQENEDEDKDTSKKEQKSKKK